MTAAQKAAALKRAQQTAGAVITAITGQQERENPHETEEDEEEEDEEEEEEEEESELLDK